MAIAEIGNMGNNMSIFYHEVDIERDYQKTVVSKVVRMALPKQMLKVWDLKKDGLTHYQIGQTLGIKEGTSRTYLKRANRKIEQIVMNA